MMLLLLIPSLASSDRKQYSTKPYRLQIMIEKCSSFAFAGIEVQSLRIPISTYILHILVRKSEVAAHQCCVGSYQCCAGSYQCCVGSYQCCVGSYQCCVGSYQC